MASSAQGHEHASRLLRVGGLAVDLAVERHDRVTADHDVGAGGTRLEPHGARLAQRVLAHDLLGIAAIELEDVCRLNPERDPEALENRAPLRRLRREYERARCYGSSPKNSSTSRAADSGESEPWTRFWPVSSAKSPLIEPVAASSGLVAPIT